MNWLNRHAAAIGALSAFLTAVIALSALVAIKVQLDAADRGQRSQSAREAFGAHLALAAGMPAFAQPADGCALIGSDQGGAYTAFVDHLLYASEQMLSVQPDWQNSLADHLSPHSDYLCSASAPRGDTPEMEALLGQFRQTSCAAATACP